MSAHAPPPYDDPAVAAARLLVRLGLTGLAIGMPLAALISRRAVFLIFPVGTALILAGALLRSGGEGLRRFMRGLASPAGLAALLLAAWAAASLLWTPYLAEAQEHFAKMAGTLLLAAVACAALPRKTRIADFYLFPIGLALAAAAIIATSLLGAAAAPADADMLLQDRAVTTLAVLLWPSLSALGVRKHWTLAISLTIAVTAAAIIAWNPPALTALAAGAFAFTAARSQPRRTNQALAGAAALLFLAAPLFPQLAKFILAAKTADLKGNFQSIAAWAAIIKADVPRVFTGHGLDAASRGVLAGFLPAAAPRTLLFEIWFDLGIVGATACAALAALGFLAAGRFGKIAGAGVTATLASVLTLAILGRNTTQMWWITLIGVAAMACAGVIRTQYQVMRPKALMQGAAGRANSE